VEILVRLPFYPTLRDELKALGRWDADERGWRIPQYRRGQLEAVLARYGLASAWEMSMLRHQLAEARAEQDDPFRLLFGWLRGDLRQPAYRALARALHPDSGGDEGVMKKLNGAYHA
jgi:hypothetical protein